MGEATGWVSFLPPASPGQPGTHVTPGFTLVHPYSCFLSFFPTLAETPELGEVLVFGWHYLRGGDVWVPRGAAQVWSCRRGGVGAGLEGRVSLSGPGRGQPAWLGTHLRHLPGTVLDK